MKFTRVKSAPPLCMERNGNLKEKRTDCATELNGISKTDFERTLNGHGQSVQRIENGKFFLVSTVHVDNPGVKACTPL